jgi:Cu/Ag efflux protein CusF
MSVLSWSPATQARADQAVAAAKPEQTYTGTVQAVDPQDHTLNARHWLQTRKFNLGDDCVYILSDQIPGTVNDLRPGQKVRVSYQTSQGVRVADRIEQVPLRIEGMVKAVDPANHTLTLHRRALDKDFQIPGDCRIELLNNHPGTMADIQVGDHVTVTYETPGDKFTARQIALTSQMFTGSLVAIDLPERTIKATGEFSTKKFVLADQCAIVINGKPAGRLEDLKPNDKLVFNYDNINGVNVVNRIAPTPETPAAPNSAMTAPGPNLPGMGY